jgi:tRNA nucleotidyltransferase (CCA-adding enzyme)
VGKRLLLPRARLNELRRGNRIRIFGYGSFVIPSGVFRFQAENAARNLLCGPVENRFLDFITLRSCLTTLHFARNDTRFLPENPNAIALCAPLFVKSIPNPRRYTAFVNFNPLLHKAEHLARAVREQGGRALLVGGYVRDELLGLHPKDADIEVYGLEAAPLRELLRRFGRVECVGESFRVYKLAWWENKERFELDVSLPRRDKKVGVGHKGFEVEGDPFASIEEAARRRDFTVNAILKDPLTGEILDPFGGRADLEKKLLRVVDAAHFGEDSLRVLRAVQFAARFEMTMEPQSARLCQTIELSDLPRERIWTEWEKLLLKAPRPSLGLLLARELGVLAKLFPYLEAALSRRENQLLATLDGAAREKEKLPHPQQIALMLAALGVFLGRRGTERLLDDLNVHTLEGYDVRRAVLQLVNDRKRPADWYRKGVVPDYEFRFLSARLMPGLPRLLARLTAARGDSEAAAWFEKKMERLGIADAPPAPLLMGRHLLEMGLKPGPQIGKIVNEVYIAQLRGEVTTLDEAKVLARKDS